MREVSKYVLVTIHEKAIAVATTKQKI